MEVCDITIAGFGVCAIVAVPIVVLLGLVALIWLLSMLGGAADRMAQEPTEEAIQNRLERISGPAAVESDRRMRRIAMIALALAFLALFYFYWVTGRAPEF
jgi:hypothetical protein